MVRQQCSTLLTRRICNHTHHFPATARMAPSTSMHSMAGRKQQKRRFGARVLDRAAAETILRRANNEQNPLLGYDDDRLRFRNNLGTCTQMQCFA